MAWPGTPPARRCGGVSLLELLIAVGVLSLLAATTVPLVSRSSHPTQATEGAARVAAALRLFNDVGQHGPGLLRLSGTCARFRVAAGAHIRDVLVAVGTGRITIQ